MRAYAKSGAGGRIEKSEAGGAEASGYRVAVRALCAFTARRGDLDLRFTPAPTAREGIAGHQVVAARRGAHYEREIALAGDYGPLHVRGRADGFDPERNRLEEVKTFRGDLDAQPERHRLLHWAQAKVYGALFCRARELSSIEIALVYFDIERQSEQVIAERFERATLEAFFIGCCQAFLAWAEQEMAHLARRRQALLALRFPHPDFRPGQRALAETVYKAASTGRDLLLQAPTGIGKTVGTLFPMLKAMPGKRLDRLFFLTARTTGRALALGALRALGFDGRSEAPALRSLELIARERACEHPDAACHGDACPLAAGFYDRLPAARAAAAQRGLLDHPTLREVALAHRVCPYYLGQEMAHWCDVVVADVNYWFDASAMLYALTSVHQWRVGILIDEAHNLVSRGRAMYSAELDRGALLSLRRSAPAPLEKPLDRLGRAWRALERETWPVEEEAETFLQEEGGKGSGKRSGRGAGWVSGRGAERDAADHAPLDQPPADLMRALAGVITAVNDLMVEQPVGIESALLRFYFDALHFSRTLEALSRCPPDHYLLDMTRRRVGRARRVSTLALRNVIPAPLLAPRFEAAHTSTLFSATLAPAHFYRQQLGLSSETPWCEMASPFDRQQLDVYIAAHISTRYRDREASLAPIVDLIKAQYESRPGNYLAFFSSFDYMERVARCLAERHPEVVQWSQHRRMDETARQAFLARFTPEGAGVGFAVLGGIFGEGVDLPGKRLVGAFIATLGLSQVNPVNERMRERLGAVFGDGYRYAYLYPGLTRVVQAAGRVIRTPEDRGVIHLIDDRFQGAEVRALLPGWWPIAPTT